MYQFLTAVLMTLYFVSALLFFRTWRRTGDRFFVWFSAAFALLGIERLLLGVLNLPESPNVEIYVIRLIGFVLIIVAIVGKNRAAG